MSEDKLKQCGGCVHFSEFPKFVSEMYPGDADGMCMKFNARGMKDNAFADGCPAFMTKGIKVKPRRICPFCEQGKPLWDDYGSYTLAFTKLTPLPPINLTTGEIGKAKSEPEFSMFLYEDADCAEGERAAFPIRFCPVCGRKLGGKP